MIGQVVLCSTLCLIAAIATAVRIPWRYNVRNLALRWKTTSVVVLAFTLVTGMLTVMCGFVNGMNHLTRAAGNPANVIVVSEMETDEVISRLSPADVMQIETLPAIQRWNGQPLASRETCVLVQQTIDSVSKYASKRRFVQVRGIEDPRIAAIVHGAAIEQGGNWFSQAGVRSLSSQANEPAVEAVLGAAIARELARDREVDDPTSAQDHESLRVGNRFELAGRTWVVVGIIAETSSPIDCEIWAKCSIVGALFGKETYTTLIVRAPDRQSARRLASYLNLDYKSVIVQAEVESEYYRRLTATNRQFSYAIMVIAIVMAIGGFLGVMTTMFAAVSERTRDIALLRLLGYGRWQILASLLLESLLIAVVGGIAGCSLALLANGTSATSMASTVIGLGKVLMFRIHIDSATLAVGVLFAAATGLAGGLCPAALAMRVSPLAVVNR